MIFAPENRSTVGIVLLFLAMAAYGVVTWVTTPGHPARGPIGTCARDLR